MIKIDKEKIKKITVSLLAEHYSKSKFKPTKCVGLSEEDRLMFSKVMKIKDGEPYYQYHKYGAMRDE